MKKIMVIGLVMLFVVTTCAFAAPHGPATPAQIDQSNPDPAPEGITLPYSDGSVPANSNAPDYISPGYGPT